MLIMTQHVSDTADPFCPQNQQLPVLSLHRAFVFIFLPPQVDSGLVAILCAQEDAEILFQQNKKTLDLQHKSRQLTQSHQDTIHMFILQILSYVSTE